MSICIFRILVSSKQEYHVVARNIDDALECFLSKHGDKKGRVYGMERLTYENVLVSPNASN